MNAAFSFIGYGFQEFINGDSVVTFLDCHIVADSRCHLATLNFFFTDDDSVRHFRDLGWPDLLADRFVGVIDD